jgi:hypothetical protein
MGWDIGTPKFKCLVSSSIHMYTTFSFNLDEEKFINALLNQARWPHHRQADDLVYLPYQRARMEPPEQWLLHGRVNRLPKRSPSDLFLQPWTPVPRTIRASRKKMKLDWGEVNSLQEGADPQVWHSKLLALCVTLGTALDVTAPTAMSRQCGSLGGVSPGLSPLLRSLASHAARSSTSATMRYSVTSPPSPPGPGACRSGWDGNKHVRRPNGGGRMTSLTLW